MPDLSLAVALTRTLLGLPDLDLNDHLNYYLSANALGAQQTFNRNQVASPFLDGAVTTFRTRAVVQQPVAVEVLGADHAEVTANVRALLDAACQDSYRLNVSVNGVAHAWACEAADYQVDWSAARLVACQALVSLSIPMQPEPLVAGSY